MSCTFIFTGPIELAGSSLADLYSLPQALKYIQSVQGTIPYMCERAHVPVHSPHNNTLADLEKDVNFIAQELGTVMEDMAGQLDANPWLADEDTDMYFEFACTASHKVGVSAVWLCYCWLPACLATSHPMLARPLLTCTCFTSIRAHK